MPSVISIIGFHCWIFRIGLGNPSRALSWQTSVVSSTWRPVARQQSSPQDKGLSPDENLDLTDVGEAIMERSPRSLQQIDTTYLVQTSGDSS